MELSEGLTFAEDGAEVSAVVGIGEHKGANWGRIAQDQRDARRPPELILKVDFGI